MFGETKKIGWKSWPDIGLEFLWLSVLFFLPLIFWPFAYTSFELPKIVFFRSVVFLMVVLFVIKFIINKKIIFNVFKENKIPAILLILPVFSWFFSTILAQASAVGFYGIYPRFQGFLSWMMYLIFGMIVFVNLKERNQLERIYAVIALSTLITSCLALIQRTRLDFLNFWDSSVFLGRLFGTMGHPDYLGGFLIMVIPLLIARIINEKGRWLNAISLIMALVVLHFTLSRAAFLGLFVGMLIFLLVYVKKNQHHKIFWTAVLIPAVAVLAFIIINIFANNPVVKNNMLFNRMVLSGENMRSLQSRWFIWGSSLNLILQKPFFGYGMDSFAIYFPKFAPMELNVLENFGDFPDRAHNLILDYWVQFGLVGVIIFGAFLFYIFKKTIKYFFSPYQNDWMMPLAVFCGLIGIIVANQFGFFVTVQWVYFWFFMAILFKFCAFQKMEIIKNNSWHGRFGAAVLIVFGFFNFIQNDLNLARADVAYKAGGDKLALNKTEAALNNVAEAGIFAPQYAFYALQEAQISLKLIDQLDDNNRQLAILNNALEAVEQAGKNNNYDGFYYFVKAKILAKAAALLSNSDFTQTDFAFAQAEKIMPVYPFTYLEYGKVLMDRGDLQKAGEQFETYLRLSPPYYQWKKDLAKRSKEDQTKYRIFYKLNPDFDLVLMYLKEVYSKLGDQKALQAID